jgi:Eukaryotic aspartyl protease
MRTSLILACAGLANFCLAEPGVLSLRTYKNHEKHAQALKKRDLDRVTKRDSFTVTLTNYPYLGGGFYFVNATVGTPPQEVQLDIDTGSSDVWMFGVHSCDITTSVCAGGAFDDTQSTSVTVIDQGGFQIQYFTAGSGVTGDYIADSFTIGKQTIKNLTMGLATQAVSVSTGIMGIGFDTNEALVASEEASGEPDPQPYANLIDEMKAQGLINVRSYSLYLDDLEADTGSIIFGGIDKAKFQGELGILDIQPDSQSGTYSTFGVILNSVGVTDNTGSTVLSTSNMPNVVILDSGTAFTIIPSDLLAELTTYFGAVNDETYGLIVRCDLGGKTGTLDYQFAGPTGPLVSVPFEELAVPLVDENGDPITDTKNNPVCRLGLAEQSSADEPLLFGDTFLRSAYVVYDLDNLQIGIAQTLFNTTESNIQAISAGKGQNLPGNVASVVTTIIQTNTEAIGAAETFFSGTPTAVHTAVGGGGDASVLSGYKTTYTNRATNLVASTNTHATGTGATGSSATKKAGASSLKGVTGGFWTGLLVQGLIVTVASVIGATLII